MANSYIASPSMGILVAVAVALHNLPEELAMAAPLVADRARRFLFLAAALSGLAEPAGGLLGLAAVHFYPQLNALFLAFAAGAMVLVSVHELLPMARRYGHPRLFTTGAVASARTCATSSAR
ncbi:ZIP family metal transporter [Thiohalorhabdus sp.]|uniref:ZIP family metal transporter n=1 Tax=Thiohalorhabdus sp. TaxID=3094134 RepID=UPI003FCC8B79